MKRLAIVASLVSALLAVAAGATALASPQPQAPSASANGPFEKPLANESAVVTETGCYTYTHIDIATVERVPGLQFARTYRSCEDYLGRMGRGWTHSYAIGLFSLGDGTQNLRLVDAKGWPSSTYKWRPDGSYGTPEGFTASVVKNADRTYTVTHRNGLTWDFNSIGKLTRIVAPNGATTHLTYQPTGSLESIIEPGGRGALKLEYDPRTGLLSRVVDWMEPQRAVEYSYTSGGRLETVTDREGNVTRFAYHGDSLRIASITDARDNVVQTLEYNDKNQAARRWDARGLITGQERILAISSKPDGTKTSAHSYPPSAFDPSYRPWIIDQYDERGLIIRKTRTSSLRDEPLIEEYSYNEKATGVVTTRRGGSTPMPDGTPVTPEQLVVMGMEKPELRPDSIMTMLLNIVAASADTTEDEFGRTASITNLGGQYGGIGPDIQSVGIRYDREDRIRFLDLYPRAPGVETRSTEFRYDQVGNLIEVIQPDGAWTRYSYDERDNLIEERTSSGESAGYAYDDRGYLSQSSIWMFGSLNPIVTEYAHDGLGRLRRIVRYYSWPEKTGALVVEFGYDERGQQSAFLMETGPADRTRVHALDNPAHDA